ncbi:MAG: MotA/TolQ/ExbB proton channel family protein [Armatimonadetes bacterium]|nr:MotA/TolQ/ExbB proton channel family protein [Armatimonadota bacterium]
MSNLLHFIHGGGVVMYPLLALSLATVVVIVERLIAFRQYGGTAPGLLDSVLLLSRQGRYDDALEACRGRRGPLAACLAVVLEHRQQPVREIERLVEETGQDYFIRLEQMLPALDTTATISPLLGLLGTIAGMIGAFNAIALQTHHGNTDSVLSGVGEALYATATGLIIAVICFAAYNYFTARYRTITAQTEQAATKLINVLVERHHEARAGHGRDNHVAQSAGEEEGHAVQTAT